MMKEEVEPRRLKLALAQLPARLQRARSVFHNLTGLTAVTGLRSAAPQHGDALPLSPPVHPLCVEQIRRADDPPCDAQWAFHIRSSLRSRQSHSHTCPLGLRCSCVPIYLGEDLVGVAKLVVDRRMSSDAFSSATGTLALAVASACQESYASVLWEELQALRQRVSAFQRLASPGVRSLGTPPERTGSPDEETNIVDGGTIVDRALDHLHQCFTDPDLSRAAVASALNCSPNYLTQRFTQVVGQQLHDYIVTLRVERVCRLLLGTDLPIKQIALESGFRDTAALSHAFHRQVGVSPSEYRRIFAGR